MSKKKTKKLVNCNEAFANAKAYIKVPVEDYIPNLSYQSLFDEAYNMALTLQEIDSELRTAAQCEGNYPGGYPPEKLLPQLCKIMYADPGYWQHEKYKRRKSSTKKTDN